MQNGGINVKVKKRSVNDLTLSLSYLVFDRKIPLLYHTKFAEYLCEFFNRCIYLLLRMCSHECYAH